MTLDTRIYVHGQVDVPELFREGQRLLSLDDDKHRDPSEQQWEDKPYTVFADGKWIDDPDGTRSIRNRISQGLPGILDITYRPDGPLKTDPEACDRWCDDPCDQESPHEPAHWCEISIDTGYGYQDEHGGCANLHARLIAQFGNWLEARNVSWSWKNEYTNEIHEGVNGLAEFCADGAKSQGWFRNIVKPGIEAMAAREGAAVEWH